MSIRSRATPPEASHFHIRYPPLPDDTSPDALPPLSACSTPPPSPPRRARAPAAGQGTVEYVALILLLALVFAAVVKFGAGKDFDIGKTIVTKLKDAIDGVGEAPKASR